MMPEHSPLGFTNVDPLTGQPVTPPVTNERVNFGWEYMWHCHILSHEEMDMMRPVVMIADRQLPIAPVLAAEVGAASVALTWQDGTPPDLLSTWGNPANEVGHRVERAVDAGAFETIGTALANGTSFVDAAPVNPATNAYRVVAWNAAGEAASNVVSAAYLPVPATGVTLTPSLESPQPAGTAVTFTAAGQGGSGTYQYRFWLDRGTGPVIVRDWSAVDAWTMPGTTAAGTYRVVVHVRTSPTVTSWDARTQLFYTLGALAPATGVTLTPSLTSPRPAGTPITFTAQGQGSAGYQYRFWLDPGTGPTIVRDWSTVDTWTMPGTTAAGTYRVVVHVRTSLTVTSYDARAQLSYTLTSSTPAVPATGVTLAPSPGSPQPAGTPVTFTAAGQGGSGTYQYRFWLDPGTGPVIVRNWSTVDTWTMPGTTAAGTYRVVVHVRTSPTVTSWDARQQLFYVLQPALAGP
jgi:hypothetical protein